MYLHRPQSVNDALGRERLMASIFDDVLSELSNAICFKKFDHASVLGQLGLSGDSRKLMTSGAL